MKKLLLGGLIVGVTVLASCSSSRQPSSGFEPGTETVTPYQTVTPAFAAPNGQKKIGPYVWVWHTAKLNQRGDATIETDCPVNYAVIAGGFRSKDTNFKGGYPNQALTGWIVIAFGYAGNKATVFADCAPVK